MQVENHKEEAIKEGRKTKQKIKRQEVIIKKKA
jgi:hypothetical protein